MFVLKKSWRTFSLTWACLIQTPVIGTTDAFLWPNWHTLILTVVKHKKLKKAMKDKVLTLKAQSWYILVVINDYRVRSTALSCAIVRPAVWLFFGSSFVLSVLCNYQLWRWNICNKRSWVENFSGYVVELKNNRKYFQSACCVTPSNFKITHIIFGKMLSIFEKSETYKPVCYFGLLLKRYFTKMPRNLHDYKAVKMSNWSE